MRPSIASRIALALVVLLTGPASADAFVYSSGSGFIRVNYTGGQLVPVWELAAGAVVDGQPLAAPASYSPASLVVLTDQPFTPRDVDPAYGFIGVPPGFPIFDIPAVNSPGEPFIAFGADTLVPGDWISLTVDLLAVTRPAGSEFSVYIPAGNNPVINFATSNGIDAGDSLTPVLGGHSHHTFAFTDMGVYQALVQWSGVHTLDGPKSAQAVLTFNAVIPEPSATASLLALGALASAALTSRRRHAS